MPVLSKISHADIIRLLNKPGFANESKWVSFFGYSEKTGQPAPIPVEGEIKIPPIEIPPASPQPPQILNDWNLDFTASAAIGRTRNYPNRSK
jgi:hypothetical protein